MATEIVPAQVPVYGDVISTCLSLITFGILAICLTRRIQPVNSWKSLSIASWLVIIIYIDSILFVFATAILSRGLGINESIQICEAAILVCLVCYMTTKVLIYYFLVEKAYIIRGSLRPRFKTKLWLFNFCGMIVPYVVVILLNFVYRIAYINGQGMCIIGMEKKSMFPLIIFDVLVNVYLTILFLVPLRQLYSYQNKRSTPLHRMALRTFLGSCATLISSVVNLTVLMVLRGEPAWICLMCCNADVLFSVVVLHWVTQIDNRPSATSTHSAGPRTNHTSQGMPRSRRGSTSWTEHGTVEQTNQGLKFASTMMTECAAGGDKSAVGDGRGSEDDILELREIRVRTDHKVEFDGASIREDSLTSMRAQSERGVSAEKMV
ncbi:hypothetical protein P154DRAFT_200776 [Amniculicola lignicola CBS 123094]|uniref:G-protein coupled receptors family 1 profile domain-containing protein n=1 Tax=Amniculicola lignicola CBS 123094 TaxID=1392246 RepID=A0A6A5WHC2_9PLEO|nr:hypothetical protein P154DRAFT_200776 [Amniculicola lignicola CBS 123094]